MTRLDPKLTCGETISFDDLVGAQTNDSGVVRPSGRQDNGVVAGGRREHDHDDELKRRIAEAGHVRVVVVDDNPYVC
jgi:hypothetical protein